MDMTKDIMDFDRKLESEQYEANDYTTMNAENTEMDYETAKVEAEETNEPSSSEPLMEQKPLIKEEEEEETKKPNVVEPPMTPPPRPLTSSEVVGHTEPDEPELRVQLTAKKSRSLPVSPQPLVAHNLTAIGLFEFGKQIENKPMLTQKLGLGLSSSPAAAQRKPQFSAGSGAGGDNQQFCLRWNNYQSNLTNVFDELLQSESFVDVTLACEGHSIKAHKMVLSACSPYFQALFYDNPCQHPIIIMRDVNYGDLKALVEFMYKGEINVCQDQINPLLKVAETLKIRGLAEVSAGSGGASAGLSGASLLPEQRMTVYDEDDDEELAILRDTDEDEQSALLKPKRARLLEKLQAQSALDLNQRQRKRSRDGSYATPSPLPLPLPLRAESPKRATPNSSSSLQQGAQQPLAMTTSTIVRNPFASPNPQALQSGSSASSSSSGGSTVGSSSCSSNSASSSSAAPATTAYRSNARSCSPQPPPPPAPSSSQQSHNGSSSASLSSPTGKSSGSAQAQLPPHMAAAVAAAAHHSGSGSVVPPSASHHHAAAAAAQQLAAQHQLAHSHAAMASALGASLAAAAAGGASAPGNGGAGSGVGNSGSSSVGGHHDDMEIKPEIAEMIREEERAKMIETSGHGWMGAPATGASVAADSYQYQLQSMWQKCWNTNQQNLVQQLRFRERGPLKSWRPEAMAEAIFSVLKEGLSLSQAARKYDIPYPTFVLYANRVHNMLGPSLDGGTDPRPKARGRPQRILLGMWPEELIRSVIKAVVFRDYREIKEEMGAHQYANGQAHGAHFGSGNSPAANGYHSAVKMAAQNAALAPPDGSNPLSTMTETLRRQILSQQQQQQQQQQQSPHVQSMNMYKSPAYLQRSEIEDQVSAAAAAKHQQNERRGSENLPDLSALGLMGLPGLNVMPSQQAHQRVGGGGGAAGNGGSAGAAMHPSAASYARELSRERERDRELKEAMHARQYGNQSRGSNSSVSSKSAAGSSNRPGAASPYSALYSKHAKEHPNYAYNKRFLESLPAGIDFEAIANGLLHKSVNKSPRFEDFFPGQDMSELFASASDAGAGAGASAAAAAAAAAAAYAPAALRESPLMKIKLEHQQQATELPHED